MSGREPVRIDHALADLTDSMGWYGAGIMNGVTLGRQQAEDEHRGRHEVSAAIARQVAQTGPSADLADKRGQHARAEAQRRTLRERGIA